MTVNAEEAGFDFPVFGFEPEQTVGWQCDGPEGFATVCESTFRSQWPKTLELVDACGRRWAVKSVRRVKRSGGLIKWLLLAPLGMNRCLIHWDLDPLPSLTLAEVQELACDAIARFGELDDWNKELEAETAGMIAQIRGANSIAQLAPILNWPSFSY